MFAGILFLALTASHLYVDVSAQALCANRLALGELRSLKSKKCIDVANTGGFGSIQTHSCDGYADQQFILCGDGTIRNQKVNYCITPQGLGGKWNRLVSAPCRLYPGIPKSQKWRLGRSKTFYDAGGIKQTAREIINVASGKCIDIVNRDGHGAIGLFPCENQDDQYFYLRSRGKQVARGRLRNEKSNQCLDVHGIDGKGDVQMFKCEDSMDQWFRYYENGELVNEKSRQCLDVAGLRGSGNIAVHPCEDRADQMWKRPKSLCNGEYCSFVNKKSSLCLDVAGHDGYGAVFTFSCEGVADQRLKFVTDRWTAPVASWVMVGCNQNGKVSQTISNTVEYSSTITTSVSVSVSASIEADLLFAKASASVEVATSLSSAWTSSQSGTTSIAFTCETYDNQEEFTKGENKGDFA
eukprot:gene19586-biopygen14542